MYSPLYFPVPTPSTHMTLGDLGLAAPDGWPQLPARAIAGPSDTNPSFVDMGSGNFLNIYTGEIVDTQTMQQVSAIAQTNPAILAQTVAQLPQNAASPAIQSQAQQGSVPTAQSTGLTAGILPGDIFGWFKRSTTIFGSAIPNWALAGGGSVIAWSLFRVGSRSRGRR